MLLTGPLQEGRAEVWRTRPFGAIALVWKRGPGRVEAGALSRREPRAWGRRVFWQPQH